MLFLKVAVAIVAYVLFALVLARICGTNSRLDEEVDKMPLPNKPFPIDHKHFPAA